MTFMREKKTSLIFSAKTYGVMVGHPTSHISDCFLLFILLKVGCLGLAGLEILKLTTALLPRTTKMFI